MLVFSGPCDATGFLFRKIVAVILAIGICQISGVSSVKLASEVARSAVLSDPNFYSTADVLEPPTNGNSRSKRSPVMDMIYSSISYRTADSKSRTLFAPNQPDPAKLLDELHDYTNFQSIDRNHFNSIDKTHPYYSALHPHLPSSLRNEDESSVDHVRTPNYHPEADEIKYVDATKFSYYLPDDPLEPTAFQQYPSQEAPSKKYSPTAPPEEAAPQVYYKPNENPPPVAYYASPQPYTMKILKEEPYDNEYEVSPPIAPFTPPPESPKYEAENPYDLNGRRGGHGGGGHGGHGGHGGGGHGGSHGHGTSSHHSEGPPQASKPPPYTFNPHPSVKAALLELRRRLTNNMSEGEDAMMERRDLHPRSSSSSYTAKEESTYPPTTPAYAYSAPVPSYGSGKKVGVVEKLYVPTTPIAYEEQQPPSYGQPSPPPPPPYPQPSVKNETNYKAPYDSPKYPEDPIHKIYEYTTKAPEEAPYETPSPDSPPYLATSGADAQETGNLYNEVAPEESPYDKFYYVDHNNIDYGSLAHISSDVHPEPQPIYTKAYPTDGPLYEVKGRPYPPPTYTPSTSSPPTYPEDPYASPDETYGTPTTKSPSYDLPATSPKPKPYNQPSSSYGDYPSSSNRVYTTSSPISEYYVPTTSSPYSSQSYTANPVSPQSEAKRYSTYDVETRAEHHPNADGGSQSNSHSSKDHVAFVGQPETPSRVVSFNNVQYKVITDTLTPPKSLDPSSAFSSESPNRPAAPQNNQRTTMDPQTARRVLELLTRVYAAKAQPGQRYDPSRTQQARYYYNYPSTTNSKPTFSPYLSNVHSSGYQHFPQVVPVRSESTQTYRLQGTRNIPPASYSQLNNPSVVHYPYRFANNNPPSNDNQQPGNPSSSGNPFPAYQYVYTANQVKSGESSSYANSYSTGYSNRPTSPRRKRSISVERSVPTGNRYSYVKSPSALNPEDHNSLDDDFDDYYSPEDSNDSNWDDNTEKEFDEFFNHWLIKSLKKPETMRPPAPPPPKTSAFKSGKKLTRNFSTNRFSIPTTTTTTTSTTTTPRTKLYRKDPKVSKRGKPSEKDGGISSHKKTPSKGPKPPKTIYKIRSPHKNMSREQIEEMLRASGLDLENAEIQIVNAEEFDEHTSHTRPSRPRPISPVDTFRPSQHYRHTTLKPTTTTTQPSTTKKVYVPHKDTERHEDGSFVYIGSHNLIFPGLYSDET